MSWLDFVIEQWLLISLLVAMAAAFFILESRKSGSSVSHHQATRQLNSGEAIILDVRDPKEFKAGHIVDAVNIPHASLRNRIDELAKYKTKQIIVVDKFGQHAGAAGRILREQGFNVVRLQGGIAEWTHQNLPLIKA